MKPSWTLFAGLYPFGAGAMGTNLFFAGLIGTWLGWPALTPVQAALGGLVLGVPATWAFARHITRLMHEADRSRPRGPARQGANRFRKAPGSPDPLDDRQGPGPSMDGSRHPMR